MLCMYCTSNSSIDSSSMSAFGTACVEEEGGGGGDGEKIYEEEGTLLSVMMPAANITLLECNRKSGRYKTRNGTGSN